MAFAAQATSASTSYRSIEPTYISGTRCHEGRIVSLSVLHGSWLRELQTISANQRRRFATSSELTFFHA